MVTKKQIALYDQTEQLLFQDVEGKNQWQWIVNSVQKGSYEYAILTLARHWAKCIQVFIRDGKKLEDVAGEIYHDFSEVSLFSLGFAVDFLKDTWRYGRELDKWYKKHYDSTFAVEYDPKDNSEE